MNADIAKQLGVQMTDKTVKAKVFDTIHDINKMIQGKAVIWTELIWSQKD